MDVSWKHSSLASGCKLLRCALIPPSNSCCTCWLTAVPGELQPGCDIPAGVATGRGAAAIPRSLHQQMHPEENFYSPWDKLPVPSNTYSKMQPFVNGKKIILAFFPLCSVCAVGVPLWYRKTRPFTLAIGVSFLFSLYTFMLWAHHVLKISNLTHKINFYAPFLFHLNLQNKGHMGFNYCLWQMPPHCTKTIFHPTPQKISLLIMVKMLLSHHSSTFSLVSTFCDWGSAPQQIWIITSSPKSTQVCWLPYWGSSPVYYGVNISMKLILEAEVQFF